LQGFAVYLNSADKFSIHTQEEKDHILQDMDEVVKNYRAKMQTEMQG
jgi:hypothetical protein